MNLLEQFKEVAIMGEEVKNELREKKFFSKYTKYLAAIAGIIFGCSSYFATKELLPAGVGTHIFAFVGLITAFYFVAKFTQIIIGFIVWIAARMFNYKFPIILIVRVLNFAYLPLWFGAFLLPFLTVAPNPISGAGLYAAYIYLAGIFIWSIRSAIHAIHGLLSCTIHEARVIIGISCAFILTIMIIFT